MWARRRRRKSDEDLGNALAGYMLDWPGWSHRRVESIALLEGERSRRRVSMDLTVPDLSWPPDADEPAHTVVPVAAITKIDMRQFNATDAGGASVPILSSADNAMLSEVFIGALLAAETGVDLDQSDRDDIKAVVDGIPPASIERLEALVTRRGLGYTVTQQYLVTTAENFLLFALLPYESAGTRTVIKFSYQWSTEPRLTGYDWWKDRALRIRAAIGFAPYGFRINLPDVQTAASNHLEVPAPPGLHSVDLVLYDVDGDEVAADREPGTVAHARTTASRPAEYGLVRFDPDVAGLHRIVMWSAWGVAALLYVTYARLSQVVSDPGTPVSLLLFGPAILLTLLTRPGENWLVSAVISPLRVLAVVLAGFLFAVGFGLSTGFHPAPHSTFLGEAADIAWRASIIVSGLSGIILTIGQFLVRHRQKRGGVRRG